MAFASSSNKSNARAPGSSGLGVHGLPISILSIFLALLASMGGFVFGYDTGQISCLLLMDDFKERFAQYHLSTGEYEFSNVRSGLIVALLSVGTLFGAIGGAPIADFFGRRNAMSIECGLFTAGVIVQITAFHAWYQFAIGRFIAGVAIGALSAVVPMYQAELAPAQIRGTLTATYQLFITFGILVAYCISIGTREVVGSGSWRTVVGISILWALILGLGIRFMPESPRWSARHGDIEAARQAVASVRALHADHPIVMSELEEILASIEVQDGVSRERLLSGDVPGRSEGKSAKARGLQGWLSCFNGFKKGSSRLGYRTVLGMTLQSIQQLTGANYFFYYGATIFQSVGISDSFVTQIILGAVNFICTFGGLYVLERFGRRNPLIIGGCWQSFWLFVFAAAGTAKDPAENPAIGKLMIVCACFFILGYAMTWAPCTWIIVGEMFPTQIRAKSGSLSTAGNWFFNFLIAFFTPFIVSAIKFRYGFIFAAFNLTGALVVYFFLYESSGMSLENVDLMYRDPSAQPWTSRRWAPPGYNSRHDLESEAQKPRRAPIDHSETDAEKAIPGAGPSTRGYSNMNGDGDMGLSALGAEEEARVESVEMRS